MNTYHFILPLVGYPSNVTIHRYSDKDGPKTAIYEDDIPVCVIDRPGESMMLAHYRKFNPNPERNHKKWSED